MLCTGIRWEFLPQELGCGSGMTCSRRLRSWNEAGVWRRLHEVLLAELQYVHLFEDWNRGIYQILSVIQPASGTVFQLITQLSDPSARMRIRAADSLGKMGQIAQQAIPTLVHLLDDENETVQAAAAEALGGIAIPDEAVVSKLLSLAKDDGHHYYPSMHASASLVKMGQVAVAPLVRAFGSADVRTRDAAIQTVIKIGQPAVATLTSSLGSEDVRVQSGVVAALGGIGKAVAESSVASPVPRLLQILQRDEDDFARANAAATLGRIGDAAAVPSLVAALSDPNYLCTTAALALGEIGDPPVIDALVTVLQDSHKFWVPRGAAAVALGMMGGKASRAIPALTGALQYDTQGEGETWDERSREAVVDALRRIRDPSAGSMLTGRGYRYEMWGIY